MCAYYKWKGLPYEFLLHPLFLQAIAHILILNLIMLKCMHHKKPKC